MKGSCLKFYIHENRRHHGILLYEWLLERARQLGIQGGSAFRAVAGYGRHGVLHEAHFFELAGDLPIEVQFFVSEDEAGQLLDLVRLEKIQVFYALFEADYGILNGA